MRRKCSKLIIVISVVSASAFTSGCAGPSTPLGAIWDTELEPTVEAASLGSPGSPIGPTIRFNPPRQVLHGRRAMTVLIDDAIGIDPAYKLKVTYNGYDVTRAFLKQARITLAQNGHELVIKVPNVRFSSKREHQVKITYYTRKGTIAESRVIGELRPPMCGAFDDKPIARTEDFEPSEEIIRAIDRISRQAGFNPAFVAALIAQESSFNPKTVSWAKAIGLTQVTPVAADEVSEQVGNWPKYPGINDLPIPIVKWLVMSGDINERNEWRLQPERSIRGGVAYAYYLAQRWSAPENARFLAMVADDPEVARTKLILASYNSGYSRVYSALNRYGKFWLSSDELQEARKYVNRILSLCDSFSQSEAFYENET